MTDMLKKSEKINTSDVYVKSDNLTEQWKKGELPNGMYYIKFKDGDITKDVYAFGSWWSINEQFLKQVLAEVPSYEEWRDIKDDLATCDKDLNNVCEQKEELYEENEQLKELLKEVKDYLPEFETPMNILSKIDQVLGEE